MSGQGRLEDKASKPAASTSRLIPPSTECKIKNEFGKKQTGYLPRDKLIAFLQAEFGPDKEFAAQVSSERILESKLLLIGV